MLGELETDGFASLVEQFEERTGFGDVR